MPRPKDTSTTEEVLEQWKMACRVFLELLGEDLKQMDDKSLNVAVMQIDSIQRLSSKLSKKMLQDLRDRIMTREDRDEYENAQHDRRKTIRFAKTKQRAGDTFRS